MLGFRTDRQSFELRLFKSIAQSIPGFSYVYSRARRIYDGLRLKGANVNEVFTNIFERDAWGGNFSVSGPGSDPDQTREIISELPILFRDLNISTLLDVPCGDFSWMSMVDLADIKYIGGDIVKELIQSNVDRHIRKDIQFQSLNLITDKLPKADLILCRDCLVHFSFKDIFACLHNICSSQAEYLLTTTFLNRRTNQNITTGQWRTLNFEISPFNFPEPLRLIN
jgi:hypothetical protein